MKFWVAHYQCSAEGRCGVIQFEAPNLREACLAFDRFFKGRQAVDAVCKEAAPHVKPYWGILLAVTISGWEPWAVNAETGNLERGTTGLAGRGLFEWKIDNPGLPYLEWVEERT